MPSAVLKGSGGVKGAKLARFDLVPPEAEVELAQVYGKGAEKYEDRNWEKGYDWSYSVAALERHVKKWKAGIDYDEESDLHHLAHVAWHCFALITFHYRKLGADDRQKIGVLPNLVEAVTNPEIFTEGEVDELVSDQTTPSREPNQNWESAPGENLLRRAQGSLDSNGDVEYETGDWV